MTPNEVLFYATQQRSGTVVVNWRSRFTTVAALRREGFIVRVRWSTVNWGWVIRYTHPDGGSTSLMV